MMMWSRNVSVCVFVLVTSYTVYGVDNCVYGSFSAVYGGSAISLRIWVLRYYHIAHGVRASIALAIQKENALAIFGGYSRAVKHAGQPHAAG